MMLSITSKTPAGMASPKQKRNQLFRYLFLSRYIRLLAQATATFSTNLAQASVPVAHFSINSITSNIYYYVTLLSLNRNT